MRGVGQQITQRRGEGVSRVEVHAAVVALQEEAVLRKRAAILGHVVEAVRVGVANLAGEAMPVADFEDGLEGVVVGVPVGLDLVDDAEIGKLSEVRTGCLCGGVVGVNARRRLVDVGRGHQAMSGAADVADLPQQRAAERFLKLERPVVVVGRAEILADGEEVEDLTATVASGASRRRGGEQRNSRGDGELVVGNGLHRRRTRRVAFEAVWRAVVRAVVEKRVEIRRVEVDAEAARARRSHPSGRPCRRIRGAERSCGSLSDRCC